MPTILIKSPGTPRKTVQSVKTAPRPSKARKSPPSAPKRAPKKEPYKQITRAEGLLLDTFAHNTGPNKLSNETPRLSRKEWLKWWHHNETKEQRQQQTPWQKQNREYRYQQYLNTGCRVRKPYERAYQPPEGSHPRPFRLRRRAQKRA